MILRSLEVENFRNFPNKKIKFSDDINVLYGFNGVGKTNILEAISLICLSKSFRTRSDSDLIHFEKRHFNVEADIFFDSGNQKKIRINFSHENGKRILVDHEKIRSLSQLIGYFPIVILAPEDDSITNGIPLERRRFIDVVLSQLDREYLKLLQEYNRILKQRNRVLQDAKENRYKFSEKIDPWNEELFFKARILTDKRGNFIKELAPKASEVYDNITSHLEKLSLEYQPSLRPEWYNFDAFKQKLNQQINLEILRGNTLIGPHRDEILFMLNDRELRKFGSRGQHRSFLLALKIAEYELMKEKLNESPIFLIDDVYSEIDEVREKALNRYFIKLNQIFVTTHERDVEFEVSLRQKKEINYLSVENDTFEKLHKYNFA